RVVDRDHLGLDPIEAVADRFGPHLAAGDDEQILSGEFVLVLGGPGRGGDDYPADARRLAQRRDRPLDHRPAPQLDEGLRAAGSKPLTGAGGGDDRSYCDWTTRLRRSAPPASRPGIPPRPPRPCRART